MKLEQSYACCELVRIEESDLLNFDYDDLDCGDYINIGQSFYKIIQRFEDGRGNKLVLCEKPFTVFDS